METKLVAGRLAVAALLGGLMAGPQALAASIAKKPFGTTADGTAVELYTLANDRMSVDILTYGGVVHAINVPDRDGKMGNIALGFAKLGDYLTKSPYFGNITGRYGGKSLLSSLSLSPPPEDRGKSVTGQTLIHIY